MLHLSVREISLMHTLQRHHLGGPLNMLVNTVSKWGIRTQSSYFDK
jgi:hypothetical protein